MVDVKGILDRYADDVLRGCVHYLGDIEEAEKAFEEVFVIASENGVFEKGQDILPELLFITRRVCLADTIKEKNEESFLMRFFNLSRSEIKYVMGYVGHRELVS